MEGKRGRLRASSWEPRAREREGERMEEVVRGKEGKEAEVKQEGGK